MMCDKAKRYSQSVSDVCVCVCANHLLFILIGYWWEVLATLASFTLLLFRLVVLQLLFQ